MKKPFVSVVVASYNRKYIINESIQSILSQNYPENSFEVIVVDNNSNDGTVSEIKKIFSREIDNKKIKLLDLKLNSGSSGSYIEALKVIHEDWKYMLKMDEDVVLDKDCVAELVNEAEKSEKHTFVGGKVFYFQNKNTLHAIGADLKPYYAIAKGIGVNETNHEKFSEARTLDALNGCMVLISRKIEKEIGWFDKDYFLYYDDHDLMYRSIKAKNIHRFTPKAIGYHDTKTGSKNKYANKQWLYYSTRGSLLFLKKNFKSLSVGWFLYLLAHNLKFTAGLFFLFFHSNYHNFLINLRYFFKGYLHGIQGKKGFYDINQNGLNVVVFSGGRGSINLCDGLREFSKVNDINLNLTNIINAYDDGLSTGAIRAFFDYKILGPSDLRKVQETQYEFYYPEGEGLDFFKSRTSCDFLDFKNDISKLIDNQNYKSKFFPYYQKMNYQMQEIISDSLSHFKKISEDQNKSLKIQDFALSNIIYGSLEHKYGDIKKVELMVRDAFNLPNEVFLNSSEAGYLFGLTEDGKLLKDESEIVGYEGKTPIFEIFYKKYPLLKEEEKQFKSLSGLIKKKQYLENVSSPFPDLSQDTSLAVRKADIIIYGPGTQYSSLYPTYWTKGLTEEISKSSAQKFFITNIDHDNETPEFTAADQIKQARFYLNQKGKLNFRIPELFDVIISNSPSKQDSRYIRLNMSELYQLDLKEILAEDFESIDSGKHDNLKISSLIMGANSSKWRSDS